MRAFQILVLTVAVVTLAASTAPAHHSFAAEFDRARPTKMTGTVTKVLWQNPHTFFYIDVKDEKTGKVANDCHSLHRNLRLIVKPMKNRALPDQ